MLFNKPIKYTLLTTSIITLLSACGGGGGSDNSPSTPFTPKDVNGTAVDFYLADATVQFDDCKDSAGAPIFVKTNAAGEFKFTTTANCQNSAITVTGGTDIATGLTFTGTLKLKKTNLQAINNTAVISPLTTIQSYLNSSNNADIKPILEKLGLSADTIAKLQTADFDLSKFDPAQEASAQDMAIIFTVQQLANQIEDNLQAVSKGDGTNPLNQAQAANIAFSSIIDQLKTDQLFTAGSLSINSATLDAILAQAVSQADTAINDSTVEIDPTVITQINENITAIADTLDTIASSGLTAAELQNAITSDPSIKDSITDNLKTPVYSGFSLANYSISELKGSSSALPLNIDLGALNTTLSIDFKLDNTSTELSDTVKVAFKLTGQSGVQQETLNVSISNISLAFNADGSVKQATIPSGTTVSINTTLKGVTQSSFTLNSPVNILSSNGSISLQNLIDSNAKLKEYYTQYATKLKVNDTVQVSAYVLPITYVIDASLGLQTGSVDFGGDNYLANTLTAYFKLN